MIDGITDLDREWTYQELSDSGEAIEVTMSEGQILREYWPFWSSKLEELGRHHLISPRNCIEDWVVCHWATQH